MSSVNWSGDKELRKALKALPKKAGRRVLNNALRAGARIIQKAAKQNVPVDSGDLKKSIKVKTGKASEAGPNGALVYVGPLKTKAVDPYYAHMVEFGTVKMTAQPFLRPAYDANEDKVLKEAGDAIWKAIEREAKKMGR